MDQQSNIHVEILKNQNYRVKIKDQNITSYQDICPENKVGISFMQSFEGKGKYEHVKYSYDAETSTFIIQISKKKIKDKKTIIEFTQNFYRYWGYMISQIRYFLKKPFKYGNFRLESVDALGFEYSCFFPEYDNKRIFFKFSQLQFNNNVAQMEFSRNLYPSIGYSFIKGNYYKSPRLAFLQEINNNYKFQDIFFCIEKYFTVGFTLYSLHFYPKLLQDQTQKDKFLNVMQGEVPQNKLLEEVEMKRKQFYRRVWPTTVLTSLTKTMNTFHISFQNQQKQQYCLFHVTAVFDKSDGEVKIIIKSTFLDESMIKQFEKRNKTYLSSVVIRYDNTKKQFAFQFNYRDRLLLQYVFLALEISWHKAFDRTSKIRMESTKPESSKIQLISEHVGNNVYEITCANYYMRFIVLENQQYEVETIRTDFSKDKIQAIRLEQMSQKKTQFHSLTIQPFRSDSERTTEEARQPRRPLQNHYPSLKSYINWFLNTWNLRDFYEVTRLCEICSRTDINPKFVDLLNKVITGATIQNKKIDSSIRIKAQKQQKQDIVYIVIKKSEPVGGVMSLMKQIKIFFAHDKEDQVKIDIIDRDQQHPKSNFVKISEAYRPEYFF